jgi:hypothetical protein
MTNKFKDIHVGELDIDKTCSLANPDEVLIFFPLSSLPSPKWISHFNRKISKYTEAPGVIIDGQYIIAVWPISNKEPEKLQPTLEDATTFANQECNKDRKRVEENTERMKQEEQKKREELQTFKQLLRSKKGHPS